MVDINLNRLQQLYDEEEQQSSQPPGVVLPDTTTIDTTDEEPSPPKPKPAELDIQRLQNLYDREDRKVIELNPARDAKAARENKNLADKIGVPTSVVESDPDAAKSIAETNRIDNETKNSPKVRAMVTKGVPITDEVSLWVRMERWATQFGEDLSKLDEAFGQGIDQVEQADIGAQRLLAWASGTPLSPETLKRLEKLEKEHQYKAKTFVGGIGVETSRQLPILGRLIAAYGAGFGVGAAPGAVAGSVVPGWGTVTGALITGVPAAKLAGATAVFALEGGLAFNEFMQIKGKQGTPMDEDLAAGAAITVGTLNAALELVSLKLISKTIPGAEKLFGFASRRTMKKMLEDPTIGKALRTIARRWGTAAGGESITEGMQELVTAAGGEILKMMQEERTGDEFKSMTAEQFWSRIFHSMEAGLQAGIGIGLPGSVASTVTETRRITKAKREGAAYKARLQKVFEEAGQSNVAVESPELFQGVLEEIAADTDMETVRVNAAGIDAVLEADAPVVLDLEDLGRKPSARFFDAAGIDPEEAEFKARLGLDVEIPVADFIRATKELDMPEAVLANVRSSENGITLAEAEVLDVEEETKARQAVDQLRADLEGTSEGAIIANEAAAVGDAVTQAVKESFVKQARIAGDIKPEIKGLLLQQAMMTEYSSAVSEGKEFDPLDFLKSIGLEITRERYEDWKAGRQRAPVSPDQQAYDAAQAEVLRHKDLRDQARKEWKEADEKYQNTPRGSALEEETGVARDEARARLNAAEEARLDAIEVRDNAELALREQQPLDPSNILQSAVPIQRRPLRLDGTGPHGRILNWDLGEALDARHMEKYGEVFDPANNEEHYRIVINSLSSEYRNQIREVDSGTGWYIEDINRAIEVTKLIIPELSDPVNRDVFLTLAALLSPNERPVPNWEKAILAMQGYISEGRIQERKPNGKQWGTNAKGLLLFQYLIDTKGAAGAMDWARAPHTGREMAEMRRASGIFAPAEDTVSKYLAKETNLSDTYVGIEMFGPKVGEFMQNATGFDQEAVTVDVWLARTYNRLIGRVTDVPPELRRKRKIVGDVRGIAERRIIKQMIREVAGRNNIDPSAMQAALWYFEQRLYSNHGINTTSENFSGAAEIAAEKREIPVPRTGEDAQRAGETAQDVTGELYQQGTPELTPEFPVDATGDVVVGDTIRFTEGVFGGSFRNPKYLGTRTVEAEVTKDSYGEAKQQHTFTLRILASEGYDALEAGKTTRRKGRNVYRNGTARKQWDDENARQKALDEKHARGDIARAERDARRGDLYQQGPTGLTPDQITAAISAADNIIELGPRISDRENTQKLEDLMEDIRRILSDAGPQAPFVARAFVELTRIGESITAETGWETIIGKTQDLKDLLLSGRAFPANDLFQRGAPELTPEAREWFGNSEVVDDSGQPLVVYHGTSIGEVDLDIETGEMPRKRFAVEKWTDTGHPADIGEWFTESPEVADVFARGEGAHVLPVYVSMQNAMHYETYEDLEAALAESGLGGLGFHDSLKEQGYDGIIVDFADTDAQLPNGRPIVRRDFIAFDNAQMRSAMAPADLFQRDDISPLGFYSKAARLARESPQKKRDARQWLSYFKDNLKKEEFEWIIGLEEFLNSVTKDKKSVERETVAEFIDKGGISIREVVTDEGVEPGDYVSNLIQVEEKTETIDGQTVKKAFFRELNKGDSFIITHRGRTATGSSIPISIEIGESRWMVVRHFSAEDSASGEAYEQLDSVWNTPEQARDEAFERNEEDFDISGDPILTEGQDPAFDAQRRNTLPLQGVTTHGDARELIEAFLEKKYSVLPQTVAPPKPRFTQYSMPGTWSRAREFYITLPDTGAPNASATVRDWDVPPAHKTDIREADKRLVVRIRANERVDMDGKRTLFIEEVQADRQQAGHTFGWEEPRDNEVAQRIREAATEEHARLEEELGMLDLAPLAEIPDPGASGTVGQAQRIPERERTPDIQRLLEINQRMVQLGHEMDTPLRSRLAHLNDESDTLSRELEDEGLTGAARTAQNIFYGNEETGVIKVVDYEARDPRGNFPHTYFWGPVPSADMDDHLSVMRQGEAMGGQDLTAFMEENPLVEHETSPLEYWQILTDFVKDPQDYLENYVRPNLSNADEGTRAIFTERLAMLEKFMALPQFKDAFDFSVDRDDRKAIVYPASAYDALDKRHEKAWGLLDEIEEVEEALEDPDGVPRMPFALPKAWVPLAFKRMIYKAAEEGFEQIAWTSGETQAERWRQLSDIDEVNYEKIEKAGRPAWNIVVRKDNYVVEIKVDSNTQLDRLDGIDKSHLIGTFGKEMAGRIMAEEGEAIRFRSWEAVQSDNTHVDLNIYPEENFGGNKQQIRVNKVQLAKWIGSTGARKVFQKMEDDAHAVVGAEEKVARKMPRLDPDRDMKTIKGLDMKVGGTKLRIQYDEIMPKQATNIGKAFNAETAPVELPGGGALERLEDIRVIGLKPDEWVVQDFAPVKSMLAKGHELDVRDGVSEAEKLMEDTEPGGLRRVSLKEARDHVNDGGSVIASRTYAVPEPAPAVQVGVWPRIDLDPILPTREQGGVATEEDNIAAVKELFGQVGVYKNVTSDVAPGFDALSLNTVFQAEEALEHTAGRAAEVKEFNTSEDILFTGTENQALLFIDRVEANPLFADPTGAGRPMEIWDLGSDHPSGHEWAAGFTARDHWALVQEKDSTLTETDNLIRSYNEGLQRLTEIDQTETPEEVTERGTIHDFLADLRGPIEARVKILERTLNYWGVLPDNYVLTVDTSQYRHDVTIALKDTFARGAGEALELASAKGVHPEEDGPFDTASTVARLLDEAAESVRQHNEGLDGSRLNERIFAISAEFPDDTQISDIGFGTGPVQTDHFDNAVRNAFETGNTERVASMANNLSERLHHLGVLPEGFQLKTIDAAPERGFRFALRYMPPADLPFREHVGEERKVYSDRENGQIVDGTDPVTTLEAIQGVIRYTRDELYLAVNEELERLQQRAVPEAPPPEYVVEETPDGKYAVVPSVKRLRPEYADLAEWPGSGESIAPVGDRDRAETYAAFMNGKPLKQNLNLVEGDEEIDDRARLDRYAEDGPISELAEDFFVVTGETLETFGSRDEAALRKRDLVAQQTAIEAWALPITDEIAAFSLEEGWPMWQEPGDPLGAFSAEDPMNLKIALFENADLSSLLHESGHLFIHILERLATREGALQRTKDNYRAMLDWVGATSADDLNIKINGAEARAKQEKLGEAFEVYLKEGKAPSTALKQAFAQFREWLLRVYEQVTGRRLTVEIDDSIRQVFDRMLATDAQIEEMKAANELDVGASPSIRELMSPQERAIHAEAIAAADEEARNENLRAQQKREKLAEQDAWTNERMRVRRQVEEDVWKRAPYRALWFLSQGQYRDMETPAGMVNRRLDKKALEEMGLTKEEIQSLPRVKNKVIYTTKKDIATDPEIIAGFLGFDSGREMVDVLLNMPKVNAAIEQETDLIMRQTHGDPFSEEEMDQIIEESLYTDERRAAIQAELDALARATGQTKVGRQVVKEIVDEVFATRPVGEMLKPMRYHAASLRTAREAERAAAAGDHMAAFEKKRQHLLHHELFRRALKARDDVQKINKKLRRYQTRKMDPKKSDPDMIASIKNLLQFYEVGTVSLKKFEMEERAVSGAAVMDFIERQRANGASVILPGDLVELIGQDADGNPQFAFKTTHWRQMTLLELQGLDDMIKNLAHIGKLRSAAEKAKLKKRATDLAEGIEKSTRPRKRRKTELALPTGEELRKGSKLYAFYYEHRKLESLLRQLDGFEDLGPMWQAIFSKIAEGRNQRNKMVEKIMNDMDDIFGAYSFNERRKFKSDKSGTPIRALGGKVLTREQRLMIGLNWGNESSREAILNYSTFVENFGDAWNEEAVQEILETLEDKDLDVLEKVWETVNQFWDEIAALERRQTGVVPQKVEASPFTVRERELTGGYFPLQYDGRLSSRVAIEKQDDIMTTNRSGGFTHATTRHGFTHARVGSGGRPVTLEINVLMNHLEDVTQDLAFREAVIEADALLRQGVLRDAIVETIGMQGFDNMREVLVKVATGGHGEQLNAFMQTLKSARLNVASAIMGLNIRVILTQPLGIFQSVERIGSGRMMQGLAEFWLHPVRNIREINEQSMFMRERGKMLTRELDDISHKIEMPKMSEKAKEMGFKPIVWMDVIAVAYPTWLGAKAKAMDGKVKHVAPGDEAAAIQYADSVIRLTQGAGAPENQSMIQQSGEISKVLTMFGSYFNTTANIQSEAIEKAAMEGGRGAAPIKAASGLIYTTTLLSIIPAVIAGLVLDRTPEEDDEDEHGEVGAWARWYFLMLLNHVGAQIFLVRDIIQGITTQFTFSLTPVESLFAAAERAAERAVKIPEYLEEGGWPEVGSKMWKDLARVIGMWKGLPGTSTLIRFFDTWNKMEKDEMRHPPQNRIDAVKKLLLTGDR